MAWRRGAGLWARSSSEPFPTTSIGDAPTWEKRQARRARRRWQRRGDLPTSAPRRPPVSSPKRDVPSWVARSNHTGIPWLRRLIVVPSSGFYRLLADRHWWSWENNEGWTQCVSPQAFVDGN